MDCINILSNNNFQSKMRTKYKNIMQYFIPEAAIDTIIEWLITYNIQLRIVDERNSKLGDYRPPFVKDYHIITVNKTLNKYSFLITLTHELAHVMVYNQYGESVKPHGEEWKKMFKYLMGYFMNPSCFPSDILLGLKRYFIHTPASTYSDSEMTKILKKYNQQQEILLDEIPITSTFSIADGRVFQINQKLKKRYLCTCLKTGKQYYFSPLQQIASFSTQEFSKQN